MSRLDFTEEQRALVRRMRLGGCSGPAIALAVNRSEASVRHLIRRMGLTGVGGRLSAVRKPVVPLAEPEDHKSIREATHKLWVAVARAIANGDHLPAQRLAA